MISEQALQLCVGRVIVHIQTQLLPLARAVFGEQEVIEAMKAADEEALEKALLRSLNRWLPDRTRLMALLPVLGQAAMLEYQNLKENLLRGPEEE